MTLKHKDEKAPGRGSTDADTANKQRRGGRTETKHNTATQGGRVETQEKYKETANRDHLHSY